MKAAPYLWEEFWQFLLVLVRVPPPHVREQETQLDQSGQIRLSLVLTSAMQVSILASFYINEHWTSFTSESECVCQSHWHSFIIFVPSTAIDGAYLLTVNLWYKNKILYIICRNLNNFTVKLKVAFVTTLDTPRVTNSDWLSCPWILSDSQFNLSISKMIVKYLYEIVRIFITRITRSRLTVKSDEVSLVQSRRSTDLDIIDGGGV